MPVLHKHLPFAPWADPRTRRLPGVLPVEGGDWLRVDEAYAGQMALREGLIADAPDRVHALLPQGRDAAGELLARVVTEELPRLGFRVQGDRVTRPDGVTVVIDRDQPLLTLGRLCQNDFCLHLRQGDEHVLVGAILCFPAGWTLAEKIGRPLSRIHGPVETYDHDIARRVQRMFDAIRPEQPLWRANGLVYTDPDLHYPRTEAAPRIRPRDGVGYIRSERQCFVKLPVSGAVVFSIHTYLLDPGDLTAEQAAALAEHPLGRAGG
jgi:dimethylamine monooxygenase subunit A